MPMIAYVCDPCWEDASEQSCYPGREQIRVMPDGTWVCDTCYDERSSQWVIVGDDDDRPLWSSFPMPPEYAPVSD